MSERNDYAVTDLREAILKRASKGEPGAIPETLSAPTLETVNRLVDYLEYYDAGQSPHLPDDPTDTFMYRWLMDRLESQLVFSSTSTGNLTRMRGVAGRPGNRIDATGYDKIIDACRPAAHQILIKGAKGSGKTTKAFDIARRLHGEGVIDKVLTNVRGPEEHEAVEFSEDISRYLEFAKEPGEKLALLDEFSTSGNAYTGQQDVEQTMSRCINAFRKSEGGSLRTMFIGHENDNDIHPLVKKQSDVVIRADGKVEVGVIDCATLFRGWYDYRSDESWFRVRGLQDVPDSSPWSFDTNYFAHLEWDLDDPERQIVRGQLVENWQSYQNNGDDETDDGGDGPDVVRCEGSKENEDRCKTTSVEDQLVADTGYCRHHIDQYDDDAEEEAEEGAEE
jgi:hypothetical protein